MDVIPLAELNLHELSLSSSTGRASGTPGNTCNLQLATCNLQLATCNLQLTTYNLQLTTYNLQLTTYYLLLTTYYLLLTTYYLLLTRLDQFRVDSDRTFDALPISVGFQESESSLHMLESRLQIDLIRKLHSATLS